MFESGVLAEVDVRRHYQYRCSAGRPQSASGIWLSVIAFLANVVIAVLLIAAANLRSRLS
jgi:hypothetical protein